MEKENKNQKLIIAILSIIIVVLLALCIYFIFIKKDDNVVIDNSTYSKIDNTKDNYYVITGKTYDVYSNLDDKKTLDGNKIVLSYPVININTSSVVNVNNQIKNVFENIENEFKNRQDNGCICVKTKDYYYCDEHIIKPEFKVYEDNKFITVVIRKSGLTHCASGSSNDTIYTVSKKDGKVFNDNDILSYFGYNRDFINRELSKYIQSLYQTDISTELEDISNSLKFAINNGKLILGYNLIDETKYYSYNGTSFSVENNFAVFSS